MKRGGAWLFTLILLTLAWNFDLTTLCDALEERRLGQRIASTVDEPPDPSILLIGLNDEVFDRNRYNRLEHARVVERLTQAGARAIFLDIIFDEPRGPEFDVPLAEAIRKSGIVTVAGVYQLNDREATMEITRPHFFPELQKVVNEHGCHVGIINTSRRTSKSDTLLGVVDVNDKPEINPYGPGLQLSAAMALFAQGQHLNVRDAEAVPATAWHGPYLNVPPLRLETTPAEEHDLVTLLAPIYFHPPATGPEAKPGAPGRFPVIPYLKIADGDPAALQAVRNKFVLIGDNRRGESDLYNTPVGQLKGFEIHAQALDTLLRNRVPLYPLKGTIFQHQALLAILFLCSACSYLLERQPNLMRCVLVGLGALGVWETAVWIWDGQEAYLPQSLGEFALVIAFTISMVVRLQATKSILRTFIPAAIVDQLLQGEEIHQGAVEATVMVTDIRGYTTLSESRTPTQVLDLLNDYHTETVALYQKYGGHVLNYQGDAQIILFGHPKPLKDAPRQAILAAQAASGAVEVLRKRWKLPPDQAFNVGAGICTGKVIIADLGGQHREYTVIGELVRKCHKLQSQSQILKANIILDEETYLRCKVKPEVEKRENVTIDGLPEPVTVYITDLVD
ncbi:adenylate/guanylate cyclase domain-containing protein [bacterium]|nr:adenylate/guanylate cyclase domain-containing protein [bacterium]